MVNIGTRQHGRQRAKSVIDCNYDKDKIKSSVNAQLKHGHYEPEFIYGNGFAGQKIADILATIDLTYHKTITY